MGKLKRLLVIVPVVMGLILALNPLTALASSGTTFTAAVVGLTNVSPGQIAIKGGPLGHLVVTTKDEQNKATLDCAGDPVCGFLGLAAIEESHDSTVVLKPTGPGTFSLNGELVGKLSVLNASGQVVSSGKQEAHITGTASCVATPDGNPCGTFFINVSDSGQWRARPPISEGTYNLSIAGVVGVFLAGGGTLSGRLP